MIPSRAFVRSLYAVIAAEAALLLLNYAVLGWAGRELAYCISHGRTCR